MTREAEPGGTLAQRLRTLRERHWAGVVITQRQLAAALSAEKSVSAPLVSSWESDSNPKIPSATRLAAYATFFATSRSIEHQPYRLLSPSELTSAERTRRDELLDELLLLRTAALGAPRPDSGPPGGSTWLFPESEAVTIICAELPADKRRLLPYTDPSDPEYGDLYSYADLDSLVELFGHLRAINPRNSQITFKTASRVVSDDLSTHLVVIGGVDWNETTSDLLDRMDLPVRQMTRPPGEEHPGDIFFEVGNGKDPQRFHPVLKEVDNRHVLLEDIGHFYRAPNPYNRERTVTICNGMYGRGVLGVVRALTDLRFRERNEAYLSRRFGGLRAYGILTRVQVVRGKVTTPDWTDPDQRLYEWPEPSR